MDKKHNAFRYDFTPREFLFFLFGKKTCPACGGPMERMKLRETVKGREFNTRSSAPFHAGADVLRYRYAYRCGCCDRTYSLERLTEK